jgi:hypothetical protein
MKVEKNNDGKNSEEKQNYYWKDDLKNHLMGKKQWQVNFLNVKKLTLLKIACLFL